MTSGPFGERVLPQPPPPDSAGLTRLQYHMMDQRISARVLSDMTAIPAPTLSQYALARRWISRRHLPVLALALGISPPGELCGYVTDDQCFIIDNEWSDDNPFTYLRKFNTRPRYMHPDHMRKRLNYNKR